MAVSPLPGGRTLYRDRLLASAGRPRRTSRGIPTWAFWQWRGMRLRQLAPGLGLRPAGNRGCRGLGLGVRARLGRRHRARRRDSRHEQVRSERSSSPTGAAGCSDCGPECGSSACTTPRPATSCGPRHATSSSRGIRNPRSCPTTGPTSPGLRSRATTPTGGSKWRCAAPRSRCASRSTARPRRAGSFPSHSSASCELPYLGTLDVWRLTAYGGGLFLPVKDALAGKPGGTYGGGRYLLDTVKGADLGTGADDDTPHHRLQLRVQPVVRVRPVVVVSARASGQHRARGDSGRRADAAVRPPLARPCFTNSGADRRVAPVRSACRADTPGAFLNSGGSRGAQGARSGRTLQWVDGERDEPRRSRRRNASRALCFFVQEPVDSHTANGCADRYLRHFPIVGVPTRLPSAAGSTADGSA